MDCGGCSRGCRGGAGGGQGPCPPGSSFSLDSDFDSGSDWSSNSEPGSCSDSGFGLDSGPGSGCDLDSGLKTVYGWENEPTRTCAASASGATGVKECKKDPGRMSIGGPDAMNEGATSWAPVGSEA